MRSSQTTLSHPRPTRSDLAWQSRPGGSEVGIALRLSLPVLFVAILMGCTDEGDSNPDYPPSLPLDAEYTDCSTADDCVVVELGCCDECNGGFAVAVNVDSESVVSERFTETCQEDQACTEIGCAPWVLSCDDGTCGLERQAY